MKSQIQSRRVFFRNVVKTILPILGSLALPGAANAIVQEISVNDNSLTCNGSCSGLCTTSCYNGCKNGCFMSIASTYRKVSR